MKTLLKGPILLILLLSSGLANSQGVTTPALNPPTMVDYIVCDSSGVNTFQALPLQPAPIDSFAYYSFLWWSGDNGFSFDSMPAHDHYEKSGNTVFPPVKKMTAITTENYGSGGPPPLTYTFTTSHRNYISGPPVLPNGTNIYIQTYRNAVIDDVMYLIITYSNPNFDVNISSGTLYLDFGDYAEVAQDVMRLHSHFLPNNEKWDRRNPYLIEFDDLDPAEERSILIPVKILENDEDVLNFTVGLNQEVDPKNPNIDQGKDIFKVSPIVAHSHDPNMMIQHSNAKKQCDYRNGKIHYVTKFQNEGDIATKYIRVECFLDDKVDMDKITGITFPDKCPQFRDSLAIGSHRSGAGAICEIDKANRKIIFEMHDFKLEGTGDLSIPHIDLSRAQIEFDILVKSNYVFGPPTEAYSSIYFDRNAPITTNVVKTSCINGEGNFGGYPVKKGYGLDKGYGGFQPRPKRWWDKWKWYVIAVSVVALGGGAYRILRK